MKSNSFRLNRFDVGIAFEIFDVKSQQILNVVRFHCGNDFCVVDLNAGNRISDDEFAPVSINFFGVGQQFEKAFKSFEV